jgi:hypothetical protein
MTQEASKKFPDAVASAPHHGKRHEMSSLQTIDKISNDSCPTSVVGRKGGMGEVDRNHSSFAVLGREMGLPGIQFLCI